MPPSDLESEYGGDESDYEINSVKLFAQRKIKLQHCFSIFSKKLAQLQKILRIQKNKFDQLKQAYDEVEREKDNIKVQRLILD